MPPSHLRLKVFFFSSWIVCACFRQDEIGRRNGNITSNGAENGALIKKTLKGAYIYDVLNFFTIFMISTSPFISLCQQYVHR